MHNIESSRRRGCQHQGRKKPCPDQDVVLIVADLQMKERFILQKIRKESPVSFLISDDLVKNVWRMRTSECLHWESSGTVTIF